MRSETRVPRAVLARRQIALGDRGLLGDDDDLLLLREVQERPLGLLQLQLGLLDLVLQEGLGEGVRLEPLVQVGGNEGLGIRRGDPLRPRRVRVGVG